MIKVGWWILLFVVIWLFGAPIVLRQVSKWTEEKDATLYFSDPAIPGTVWCKMNREKWAERGTICHSNPSERNF
jgi:hypothetical protein